MFVLGFIARKNGAHTIANATTTVKPSLAIVKNREPNVLFLARLFPSRCAKNAGAKYRDICLWFSAQTNRIDPRTSLSRSTAATAYIVRPSDMPLYWKCPWSIKICAGAVANVAKAHAKFASTPRDFAVRREETPLPYHALTNAYAAGSRNTASDTITE